MNAWLTLDFVAKRYGHLPSEVLESGSSIDAKCAILATEYENYLHEKARAEANGEPAPAKLKEHDMQAMMEAARKRHAAKTEIKDGKDSQGPNTQTA